MRNSAHARQAHRDGTKGLHSSFKAILDTIGEKAPNQKQIAMLCGILAILKGIARKNDVFCGKLGADNRASVEELIDELADLKPKDVQAWSHIKEQVIEAKDICSVTRE